MADEQDDGQRVQILVDGEGHFEWLKHFRVREGKVTHLAALPQGMKPGPGGVSRASVAIFGKLKDGSYAYLQTSLRVVLAAFAQWQGAYGLEADGRSPSRMNDITRERLNAALLLKLIDDREGSEVTYSIDEINATMQNVRRTIEVQYSEDGKHITLRAKGSD